jgi:photosystem II stability/assembly factor-like uncharacterized protein
MDVRVRVLAVVATGLFGLSMRASAAINDWTAIGPGGGVVNKIGYGQNGATALMVAAGGYYRSQDSGVSWQVVKSDFLNALADVAVDPSDPTRVYVVSVNAPCLYVSTDGGATLTANTSLPTAVTQAQQIAVGNDGATLYLSDGGRIFHSPDRGLTWQERVQVNGFWKQLGSSQRESGLESDIPAGRGPWQCTNFIRIGRRSECKSAQEHGWRAPTALPGR